MKAANGKDKDNKLKFAGTKSKDLFPKKDSTISSISLYSRVTPLRSQPRGVADNFASSKRISIAEVGR